MFNCIDLVFKEQKLEPMTDSECIDFILFFSGEGSKVDISKWPGLGIFAVVKGGMFPRGKERYALGYTANSALNALWNNVSEALNHEVFTIE